MFQLLERAAQESPGQVAVITSEWAFTYAELVDDARRVASSLKRRGVTRFAIVEPDVGWIIRLLAAAALVGAEPCQYQPDTEVAVFTQQARLLGHETVVSRRSELAEGFEFLAPTDLVGEDRAEGAAPDDGQPLLIRTTGTTGEPKAARHDWGILTRRVAGVRRAPEQRWLLAYGPHQFAGVQVLLHVASAQATLIAPFPRQPRDGLQAMLRDGVTHVSATPTYWRFLLAEARSNNVDLPALEQLTLGGEASPPDLLEDLRSVFPGAGISQVYASTEFGSVLSVKDGRPGVAVSALFSEANPTSNMQVRDGELWVRTDAGMLGYATGDVPSETQAPGEWQPTGDLVEIVEDRVLFRGRTSEVINVGGVKVHPLPIEERIARLDEVSMVRVFGRPNPLTGAIVAAEIVPAGPFEKADIAKLRNGVKAAVSDLPRAWHPRSVTLVESIEMLGGKTVRGSGE